MEIKVEQYAEGGAGRVRIVDKYDVPAALIHYGPDDVIKPSKWQRRS